MMIGTTQSTVWLDLVERKTTVTREKYERRLHVSTTRLGQK